MKPTASRRRLLGLAGAGFVTLAGCGYRPGGGDVRWQADKRGLHASDDLLVADGRVFTVTRSARGFDWDTEEWGDYSTVTAYDRSSGTRLWTRDGPPVGRPATDSRTLYVGDEEGTLTALDADGTERWRCSVGDFPRTLAASAGRVYALTDSGDLRAFAAEDGEPTWTESLGAGERATLAPTRNGVVVRRNPADEAVIAAAYRNGGRRWETQLPAAPGGWDGRPTVADGTVHVFGGRELSRLSLRDGTERWSRRTEYPRGPLAVGEKSLYLVVGSTLHALDAGDGTTRWRFEPGRRSGLGLASPPAVADGTVYVGANDAVFAVNASDGTVRWRVESGRVSTRPRVVGPTVVVLTNEGSLRAHWRE